MASMHKINPGKSRLIIVNKNIRNFFAGIYQFKLT